MQPIDRATFDATLHFFDELLKLLHPFMPFITEELWQHIYERKEGESIMLARVSDATTTSADDTLIAQFEAIKEIVAGVRSIRNQKNIAPKEQLVLQVVGENKLSALNCWYNNL